MKVIDLGNGLTLEFSRINLENGSEKIRFSFRKDGKLVKDKNTFVHLFWNYRDIVYELFGESPPDEDDGPEWELKWEE